MNKIFITKNDHKKLIDLINKKWPNDDSDRALLSELEKAEIVNPEAIPGNVITMNSLVIFADAQTKSNFEYWLVFPEDADMSKRKISVLSPIGCALLGYKVGDTIPVKTPAGERLLQVEKILHQPEASGNYE